MARPRKAGAKPPTRAAAKAGGGQRRIARSGETLRQAEWRAKLLKTASAGRTTR